MLNPELAFERLCSSYDGTALVFFVVLTDYADVDVVIFERSDSPFYVVHLLLDAVRLRSALLMSFCDANTFHGALCMFGAPEELPFVLLNNCGCDARGQAVCSV